MIFFFFNDTATTEIYTLSLHDALPISALSTRRRPPHSCAPSTTWPRTWRASSGACITPPCGPKRPFTYARTTSRGLKRKAGRSEEHTSELQSRQYLVCRLLLEKKKNNR